MSKTTMSIAVSEGVKSELEDMAEEREISRSEVTYQILRQELNRESGIRDSLVENATLIGIIWLGVTLGVGFGTLVTLSTGLIMVILLVYSMLYHG